MSPRRRSESGAGADPAGRSMRADTTWSVTSRQSAASASYTRTRAVTKWNRDGLMRTKRSNDPSWNVRRTELGRGAGKGEVRKWRQAGRAGGRTGGREGTDGDAEVEKLGHVLQTGARVALGHNAHVLRVGRRATRHTRVPTPHTREEGHQRIRDAEGRYIAKKKTLDLVFLVAS